MHAWIGKWLAGRPASRSDVFFVVKKKLSKRNPLSPREPFPQREGETQEKHRSAANAEELTKPSTGMVVFGPGSP